MLNLQIYCCCWRLTGASTAAIQKQLHIPVTAQVPTCFWLLLLLLAAGGHRGNQADPGPVLQQGQPQRHQGALAGGVSVPLCEQGACHQIWCGVVPDKHQGALSARNRCSSGWL
jgi:hypothetical protein